MNVDIHDDFLFLVCLSDQLSHVVDLRLKILLATSPFSVQVASVSRKAVITVHHSIWIQHRHNFKHKMSSQKLTKLVFAN